LDGAEIACQALSRSIVVRKHLVVLAVLSLGLAPGFVCAQGFSSGIDLGAIEVRPSVRVGYQKMGFNFNLPTGAAIGGNLGAIDLKLEDARMWVGAIELGAQVGANLHFFVKGEANAGRNVEVITGQSGVSSFSQFAPYRWTGSKLEWWAVEGGAVYELGNGVSVLAGLRRDHLSLRMEDPVDPFGRSVNFQYRLPGLGVRGMGGEQAAGDLQTKLWLPYIGIRIDGENYRLSTIWSPFASAAVRVPQRLALYQAGIMIVPGLPPFTVSTFYDFGYRVSEPATLLEGTFDYDVDFPGRFGLNLWLRGSWLEVKGRGSLDAEWAYSRTFRGVVTNASSGGDSPTATATLRRYMWSGGFTASMSF